MKTLTIPFLTILIFSIPATYSTEENEHIALLSETFLNHTKTHITSGKPVVIHTQIQSDDQPTLKEYQECHENLQKCKTVCEGVEDPVVCVQRCPVCPILVREKIVVQGINDTDFSSDAKTVNTTNIIRLTNEIRNIIENQQGNLTYLSNNLVHVYQNISRVGGKFGLGYNNSEPCCIVISPHKNCNTQRFSTANRCHRKRHRVCSFKCKSRVMVAKRVTVCETPSLVSSNEDYNEEDCHLAVKYVPYQSERNTSVKSRRKCSFKPSWPYVSCSQTSVSFDRSICDRCLALPFLFILRMGIPPQCNRCFMTYTSPVTEIYSPSWNPFTVPDTLPNDDLFEDQSYSKRDGWQHENVKCRLPDGSISDECELQNTYSYDPSEILPYKRNEYLEDDYDWESRIDYEESQRKRRHTFRRSRYSRRYK